MNREYEVVIYTDVELSVDPNAMTEIGYVEELASKQHVISIVYCQNIYQKNGQHTSIQKNGYYCEHEIQMDDLYYDLMKNNPTVFEALMMHETGHLINGDIDRSDDYEAIMLKRRKMIEQYKVAEEELRADLFSVKQCGGKAVVDMLDHVIRTRKRRGYDSDDLGIREAEMRKIAVKRYIRENRLTEDN